MRTGLWPHYPFSTMLTEIGMGLPQDGGGPLAWILAQSACVVLLSIGTVIAVIGGWLIARHNKRRRLEAEAAEAAA